jgi:diguanylate cyclase (GGDEF)-like protein/PAS domain S-box-containing protein
MDGSGEWSTATEDLLADDVEFCHQLVEAAPDGIIVVDEEGVIRLANVQAERLLGWHRDELVGRPLEVLVPERFRDAHPGHRHAYFSAPRTRPMGAGLELAARRADGSEFAVDISLSPINTKRAKWAVAALRDATLRKETESRLRDAYEQVSASMAEMARSGRQLALVSEMGDMLQSAVDNEEAYAVVAAFAADLFVGTSGVIYRPASSRVVLNAGAEWGDGPPAAPTLTATDCWALRRGRPHRSSGTHGALGCRHVPALDGSSPGGWTLCIPLAAHGEILGLLHLRSTAPAAPADPRVPAAALTGGESVDELQRIAVSVAEHLSMALANLALREDLRSRSERDALTGLYNRRYFDQTLVDGLSDAAHRQEHLSLLLVDVDQFKELNDRHGHAAGDASLRTIAHLLLRETRGSDTVCRLGGDEFVALLPATSASVAAARAEQIRAVVERATDFSVSVGVATRAPSDDRSPAELLRDADLCLYRAKALGRNRVIQLEDRAPEEQLIS